MSQFRPARRLLGIEKSLIRQFFDRSLPGSINLSFGEPDHETPRIIRCAATRAIEEEQNGYTLQAGLPALRQLVAADYPHLDATPEQVIITAGSQEALYLALMTLVDEGDEVLIPDPGFVAYATVVQMAGGRPIPYSLPAARDFAFDAGEFRRRLSERTRAVVCISPSNPTGRTLSREELAAMADALKDTGAYVISDEIYRELYYTEERPASISEYYPRTVVVSGLSKSMSMTGWRLGWLCGTSEVVQSALVLHGYVTTCASTVSQKAALAAWTTEAEEERNRARRIFRQRRDFLLGLIDSELGLRVVVPDGAFYVMADITAYGNSIEVAESMLDARVITIPGGAFGREGEGFLRLSFCADKAALVEGVRRMSRALTAMVRHDYVQSPRA